MLWAEKEQESFSPLLRLSARAWGLLARDGLCPVYLAERQDLLQLLSNLN